MLSNQNKESFREIHDEAFRYSPNAAFLDDEKFGFEDKSTISLWFQKKSC
ncbi:hypothetical protein [Fervidicola ferrireducens]|nr:hypothetical protein [Fervidicola ferrireducens]